MDQKPEFKMGSKPGSIHNLYGFGPLGFWILRNPLGSLLSHLQHCGLEHDTLQYKMGDLNLILIRDVHELIRAYLLDLKLRAIPFCQLQILIVLCLALLGSLAYL